MPQFTQDAPRLGDPWASDRLLRSWLTRVIPQESRQTVLADVRRFAGRVVQEVEPAGRAAEASPPRLVTHDAWGRRVDLIETSDAWRRLGAIAAEEGLVGLPYAEGVDRAVARVHQMAKVYLAGAASAIYTCPVAMADGAARVLEMNPDADPGARVRSHLASADPDDAWVSGQWMTERTGGSDVSATQTTAEPDGDVAYRLTGEKWFASAADAPMALALARAPQDGDGLGLFLVETRRDDGSWNGSRVCRLKDKLGTRALPTAQLELDGALARRVGEPGRGVATIAPLLNVTRLHNAANSASYMRRALALAADYAKRRHAFGRPLAQHPLHAGTLADLHAEVAKAFALAMYTAHLQGLHEAGVAGREEERVLRLLTPVAKLMTGKQAVAVVSEAMEAIGGVAYMEDSGFPRLLRDAQVLPIWEGTTNVLALDALRAAGDGTALGDLAADVARRVVNVPKGPLADAAGLVGEAAATLDGLPDRMRSAGRDVVQSSARRLFLGVGAATAAALLIEHAAWCRPEGEDADWHEAVAVRASRGPLIPGNLLTDADADAGARVLASG